MPSPEPAQKTVLFADADVIRQFIAFMERTHASTEPCRCHADADLFAPEADAFDAALDAAIGKAREAHDAGRAAWLAEINETLGLLTMASKPEDVNHTLTLTLIGKLREQVNKAR